MKNSFSYENNQQCDFQVNYDYYPQQLRHSYNYQQQIVTPTSAPNISGLTLRQFNDLYPRSSFLEYEQQTYHDQQPYFEFQLQPSYVPYASQ